MPAPTKPELYVVDGSNIATEGRTVPSLEQLNEAVLAFMEAHPHATVTVVVDATFGHRIAKKEAKAFDEAVANNELVTPPAGAVGRGDAFVLAIADRAKAGVLSNDSFQEFHGDYEWLFDEGRLIGGKPVPHVGWVFVKRNPVRGPKSRQAIRDASEDATDAKERANRRVRKKSAAEPATARSEDGSDDRQTPTDAATATEPATGSTQESSREPARRGRRGRGRTKAVESIGAEQQATIEAARAVVAPKEHVNELMPFLEFVEHHPLGTSCTVVVESYSSHGAYARVDDVLVYIPLRLMDDPPPRSARSAVSIGEAIATVIVGYVPDRRSIDAALPNMAGDVSGPTPSEEFAAEASDAAPADAVEQPPAKKAPAKKAPAKKAPAKKTSAKKAPAKKAPAKKAPAEKAPAEQPAPRKPAATKAAAAKAAAAKKTPAKKAPAKKSTAKKTPAEGAVAEKVPAKTAARKTATQKAPTKRAPTKKAPARQAPTKQPAADRMSAPGND